MRLLPERTNHDRSRALERNATSHGYGNRAIDGWEYLPLRYVRPHSRSDSACIATIEITIEDTNMFTATRRTKDQEITRRSFLRASATATGGLLVSLYFERVRAQEGASAPQGPPKINYPPDAFVEIQPDGK